MQKRLFLMGILSALMALVALPAAAQDDVCVVTSIAGAVTRTGPGTDFERDAPFPADANAVAVSFEFDAVGQRWWQMEDGRWVREDLVTESEACGTPPQPSLLEDVPEDTCVVTSIAGAVTRTGPGIDNDQDAPFAAGESEVVVDSTPDLGGQIWWQIEDGRWVREDLVTESAACETGTDIDTSTVSDDAEACILTSISGANTRLGPGTDNELGAPFPANETAIAVDNAPDANGQLWWELDDGRWVREDLVSESDTCGMVNEISESALEDMGENFCVVEAIEGGNTRSGPGTTFELLAPLSAGEDAVATDAQPDVNGQDWWRLTDGRWVREDLVTESPGCAMAGETVQPLDGDSVCYATAITGAVTRSGPGTTFERLAPLPAGESAEVINSEPDVNGQDWWELDDGRWVREDLVTESNACETE